MHSAAADDVDFDALQQSLRSIQHTSSACTCCSLSATQFCDIETSERSSSHFTVWSTIGGRRVRTLADSGADTNFIDAAFAATLGKEPTPCRPRAIRLGDNHLHHVNQCLVIETYVGHMKFNISYFVMPLPQGIAAVLGMQHLQQERALLDCETR